MKRVRTEFHIYPRAIARVWGCWKEKEKEVNGQANNSAPSHNLVLPQVRGIVPRVSLVSEEEANHQLVFGWLGTNLQLGMTGAGSCMNTKTLV